MYWVVHSANLNGFVKRVMPSFSAKDKPSVRKEKRSKEFRVLDLQNRSSQKKGKREKKLEQQEKNKLWKIKHKSNNIEFEEDLNPRHTSYYQAQLPFLKLEWSQFTESLRQPLPSTFRTTSRCHWLQQQLIVDELKRFSTIIQQRFVEHEGKIISGPLLSVVPSFSLRTSTWQAQVDNRFLSKCESVRDLHQWLLNETAEGHLVRQELVSMLPAILLEPQPHHFVLDVCSAPGSKTEQLLSLMFEITNGGKEGNFGNGPHSNGFVLANDADPKRLDSLRRRFCRNRDSRLALICSDATQLSKSLHCSTSKEVLNFDRILCDVPCSGDGTFRKCPHLYRLFRPRYGLELHGVQLKILIEGLQLLKTNGRLAYSTCSLNPIEDEAVVAAALRYFLMQHGLPGFTVRKGVSLWRGDTEVFCLGDDADDITDQHETQRRVLQTISQLPFGAQSLFPPLHSSQFAPYVEGNTSSYVSSPEIERELESQLEHCLRVLPHDNNTGGFFVALFERYDNDEVNLAPGYSGTIESNGGDCFTNGVSQTGDLSDVHQNIAAMDIVENENSYESEGNEDDAHASMKRLGYNPKDKASVVRRLQCSHLSVAWNPDENTRHDWIGSENELELESFCGILPDDISVFLQLSNHNIIQFEHSEILQQNRSKIPAAMQSNAESNRASSLMCTPLLQQTTLPLPTNICDEPISNLRLTVPPKLQESLCFCILPVRTLGNGTTAIRHEVFLIQRTLANVVLSIDVVYDVGLRIGKIEHLNNKIVCVSHDTGDNYSGDYDDNAGTKETRVNQTAECFSEPMRNLLSNLIVSGVQLSVVNGKEYVCEKLQIDQCWLRKGISENEFFGHKEQYTLCKLYILSDISQTLEGMVSFELLFCDGSRNREECQIAGSVPLVQLKQFKNQDIQMLEFTIGHVPISKSGGITDELVTDEQGSKFKSGKRRISKAEKKLKQRNEVFIYPDTAIGTSQQFTQFQMLFRPKNCTENVGGDVIIADILGIWFS